MSGTEKNHLGPSVVSSTWKFGGINKQNEMCKNGRGARKVSLGHSLYWTTASLRRRAHCFMHRPLRFKEHHFHAPNARPSCSDNCNCLNWPARCLMYVSAAFMPVTARRLAVHEGLSTPYLCGRLVVTFWLIKIPVHTPDTWRNERWACEYRSDW